ncbi:MAG: family 1 glycosylhydrolase [Verrucomicrobiota bacterium]
MKLAAVAAHHVLLAHGRAVQALRAHSVRPVKIGAAPHMNAKMPLTETPADIEAARRVYAEVDTNSFWGLSLWADPIYLGKYPETATHILKNDLVSVTAEDLQLISQPLDFMGCNIYTGGYVKAGPGGEPQNIPWPEGGASGSLNWLQLMPDALYWSARFQVERYGRLPLS